MAKHKVGFLGCGAWGITLADLISRNGHDVLLWAIEDDVLSSLQEKAGHPRFPDFAVCNRIHVTWELEDLLQQCEVIVECVTAKGFRPVMEQLAKLGGKKMPIIITSKGIEQESGKLLVEVAEEYGFEQLGYLSGPTLAKEVMLKHPTSAVAASFDPKMQTLIGEVFGARHFKIFTSDDMMGVALGGAMKNVIAIASGLAEGLGYGYNTKALLIVRGLREMCRLAIFKGAKERTCYGLSGIGDLIVTGISNLSRNFQFGYLLGEGYTVEKAVEKVNMVVEGQYTVLSAYHLGKKNHLDLPITYAMYEIIYKGKHPQTTFHELLDESVKDEFS